MVERPVWLKLDHGRRTLEEGFCEHVFQKLPAYADVGLAPTRVRIWTVAVPLAWMQYDDGSTLYGNGFAAFELDDALAAADVEKLVFPVGKRAPVLPGEVVVGGMVGMWIGLTGLRDLLPGAGDVDAELSLNLSNGAVVNLVHD